MKTINIELKIQEFTQNNFASDIIAEVVADKQKADNLRANNAAVVEAMHEYLRKIQEEINIPLQPLGLEAKIRYINGSYMSGKGVNVELVITTNKSIVFGGGIRIIITCPAPCYGNVSTYTFEPVVTYSVKETSFGEKYSPFTSVDNLITEQRNYIKKLYLEKLEEEELKKITC